MTTDPEQTRVELARVLRNARLELGFGKREDMVARIAETTRIRTRSTIARTMQAAESGKTAIELGPDARVLLDKWYQLVPGSVDRILKGLPMEPDPSQVGLATVGGDVHTAEVPTAAWADPGVGKVQAQQAIKGMTMAQLVERMAMMAAELASRTEDDPTP